MGLMLRLEDIRGDVRQAARQLISAPGFTVVATLTLALGVGVTSAIFALADAALMRPRDVDRVRDAGALAATGAIVGVVLAAFSGRLISTFFFGVDPLDPLTFLTVPALILCTAPVAAAAPAWRASRIDPVVAFRQEPDGDRRRRRLRRRVAIGVDSARGQASR